MVYFPNEIFAKILDYTDDRIEVKQKKYHKELMKDLSAIVIDTWLYGQQTIEDIVENGCIDYFTPVKFCYTNETMTYEIGMDWLVYQFHPNDNNIIDSYQYFQGKVIEESFNY
jgi:hypothetical protein